MPFSEIEFSPLTPAPSGPRAGRPGENGVGGRVLPRWSAGFGLSFFFIWAVSLFFISSLPFLVYNPDLDAVIFQEGDRARWVSEGWAETRYGRRGLAGIEDVGAHPEDKIFIWGDSYVEAWQVRDEAKTAQRFTDLWNVVDGHKLLGVGIGFGGRCVADYWSEMPNYEAVLGVPRLNVIILPDMDDVMPDSPHALHARFVSTPALRFLPDPHSPDKAPPAGLRKLFHVLRLGFLVDLAKQILPHDGPNIFKSLRFTPARGADKPGRPPPDPEAAPEQRAAAWDFLLESLKTRGPAPLVFIYLPHVPRIENHAVVFRGEQDEAAEAFARACARRGVDFIDLRRDFLEFYRATGRLPRGFDNSIPGEGHLNSDGHELTARALARWIGEHRHAVLGD